MRNNDERVSENDELLDEPRSLFPREKKAHDAEKMFNRRENCYAEFETQRASQRVLSIKLGSRSSAKICYAKRNCNNEWCMMVRSGLIRNASLFGSPNPKKDSSLGLFHAMFRIVVDPFFVLGIGIF